MKKFVPNTSLVIDMNPCNLPALSLVNALDPQIGISAFYRFTVFVVSHR